MIYLQRMKINDIEQTKYAHDAMVTSFLHQNNVTTLFWRYNDVVNTSRVLWEELIIVFMKTWDTTISVRKYFNLEILNYT